MVTFIKTLAYPTTPPEGNVFKYVRQLLLQKINPPSTSSACIYIPTGSVVLHSPLMRVVSTLSPQEHTAMHKKEELSEIVFDLGAYCSENQWDEEGSTAVRKSFKALFMQDALSEKRKCIFNEIRDVLREVKNLEESGERVFIISHSFQILLFEAYIGTNGEIERNPLLIDRYMSNTEKRYSFGGVMKF